MEYLDFELRIGAGSEGRYPLVVESPAGETSESFSFAEPVLREELLAIEHARGSATAPRSLVPCKEADAPDQAARQLGRDLFDALMHGDVYAFYLSSLQLARREDKGLRLRLDIQAPDLAALPWEYLYDPKLKLCHLCLSRETPVVRHLERPLPSEPLTLEPPIRILGMIGAHHGLEADRERRLMEEAVEHLVEKGTLTLTWLEGHTWQHLLEAMRRGPWHVFHFIGHGGFDTETGEGLVLLEGGHGEGEGGGEPPAHRLPARKLADLLADHRALRLVVLSSCEGARASRTELYSSTGSILAGRGIPAVVSMQYEITDRAALVLSQTFYDVLADGMPVDEALAEARKVISTDPRITTEWGTPVLHMRSPDGQLFRVELELFQPSAAPPGARPPAPAPKPTPTPTAGVDKGLRILLQRVRKLWITGVLERSLHHAALLELGMEVMEDAVESPWGSLLETPGAGSEPLPPGQTLGQVLEEVGGSLLVLGEPGSGKTTTLLQLARDLLAAAEDDPSRPVPVVLNLSTARLADPAAGHSLAEWMVDELAAKYMIPKKVARAWLGESRILPLFDGLDELDAALRPACVEAINAFAETALVGVVVCCRLKEYLELPVRLGLNGAIRLQPLSREQVLASVTDLRLAALRALLESDSGMLVEARSPLMLSLMMQTYRDLPVEALTQEAPTTAAARRRQLMAAYVARMFRRAAAGGSHA